MPDFFTDFFDEFAKNFLLTLNTPDDYLNRIALSTVTIIIGMLLQMLLRSVINRNVSDYKRRYAIHKFSKSTIVTLTVLSVLFIWLQAINALVLIALLFGFFLVFMVKGLTNNIIGFFVIKYRKYFKVGHRVELNDIIGDVIEINPINFKLLEVRNWLSSDANTGRIIKLPNRIIFEESIEMIGVTDTFIWQEIQYVLSFDSDWQAAERIMVETGDIYFNESVVPKLKDENEHLPNEQEKLQPVFSLNTNNDGVILTLRYLVDYRNGTSVKTSLQKNILNKFSENPQIKFAVLDLRILPD